MEPETNLTRADVEEIVDASLNKGLKKVVVWFAGVFIASFVPLLGLLINNYIDKGRSSESLDSVKSEQVLMRTWKDNASTQINDNANAVKSIKESTDKIEKLVIDLLKEKQR